MVEFIVNPKTMFEFVRNGNRTPSQIKNIIDTCQYIYNEYQGECKKKELDEDDIVKPLIDKYILSGEKELVEKLCDLYGLFDFGISSIDEECYEFVGDFIMEFAILTDTEKRIIREKIAELQKRLDQLEHKNDVKGE